MRSYPEFDEVCEGLGDKVVAGLGVAVMRTREDYAEYRTTFPEYSADSTSRGAANWIHDRLFARIVAELQDLDGVSVVDREPLREIWVGLHYRLRIKRHRISGQIRTYPTTGAGLFLLQPQPTLEGLEEVHLAAGYEWDDDLGEIGPPVLSLRNGDKIVWYRELPVAASSGIVGLAPRVTPGPVAPTIGLRDEVTGEDGATADTESA